MKKEYEILRGHIWSYNKREYIKSEEITQLPTLNEHIQRQKVTPSRFAVDFAS